MFTQSTPSFDTTFKADAPVVLFVDAKISLFLLLQQWRPGNEYLLWQSFLNKLCAQYQPAGLIIGDDMRDHNFEYWRHKYLADQGYPIYKGNRSCTSKTDARPAGYNELDAALKRYIADNNIDYFGRAGLECDDFAGLAYRAKKYLDKSFILMLCSFDGDWMQLISDQHQVFIYNTGTYKKRSNLMDEAEFRLWSAQKRLPLMTPKHLISHKILFGDKGDNLLPGSPREVIDLTIAHHSLFTDNDFSLMKLALQAPKFKPNKQQAIEAEILLAQ